MKLITDRTESDALLGNERGTYSYTDLNRVETAVAGIAAEMSSMGYMVNIQTKTDWKPPGDFSDASWPVQSQMERYLRNIRTIRNCFSLEGKGVLPASMDKLTWKSANLIEMILENAENRIDAVKKAWKYSGEVFAGEE